MLNPIRIERLEVRNDICWVRDERRKTPCKRYRFRMPTDFGAWIIKTEVFNDGTGMSVSAVDGPQISHFETKSAKITAKGNGVFYGQVSQSYLDETGRLRKSYIDADDHDAAEAIRGRFETCTYDEANPCHKSRPRRGKLVALIRTPEDAAEFFYLTRIAPIEEQK